jgi:3-(3-hydroxy-phenyl)propionate hydroxylase
MGAGRHRWEFMLKAEENEYEVSAPASVANLLSSWDVDGAVELERTAAYTFEAKVAKQWMQDGVVIAGDAAHLMPPFAGQGLCSGIRDVENLTWKLGAILADRANTSLLSSYQAEREPHVRAMIDLAVMMGKVVCVTDPDVASVRDKNLIETRRANGDASGAIPNPKLVTGLLQVKSQIAGELFPQFTHENNRSDDVFGQGAWLIGESNGIDRNLLRAAGIGVPSLSFFSSAVSRWLDKTGYKAVLVRPDRVIFGGGDAAELVTAYVEGLYQEARALIR